MKNKKKKVKPITTEELDRRFDNNEDLMDYVDFEKAVFVNRVNVDFPMWMIKRLDREATKLNVSRQAIIKMWIHDRLTRTAPRTFGQRANVEAASGRSMRVLLAGR